MKIQLKRSNALDNGKAKEPTAEQMEYGELAVNFNADDPAVFIKDNNDNIIRIGGVGNIADDGQTEIPSNITPPTDPKPGNFWYNPEDGRLYYYYEDANSSQWVDASPDSQNNPVESGETFPLVALPDDLFFNTTDGRLYIYYKDGDSEQWVDASPDIQPQTNDLWKRDGTTVLPNNNGDSVEIGGTAEGNGKITLKSDGSISAAGPIQSGSAWNVGNGVTAFNGGSLYVRQDGSTSANNLITALNGGNAASNQVFRVNGDGSITAAGSVVSGSVSPGGGGGNYLSIGEVAAYCPSSDYFTWRGWDASGSSNVLTSSIKGDGSASFAGDVKIGGTLPSAPLIELKTDTSGILVNSLTGNTFQANGDGIYQIKNGVNTIVMLADGSITAAGTIQSGGDPDNGSENGAQLRDAGVFYASRDSGRTIFSGYTTGEPDVKLSLFSDGSINATGDVAAASFLTGGQLYSGYGTGTGLVRCQQNTDTNNAFVVEDSNNNFTATIKGDGSITAAGAIASESSIRAKLPGAVPTSIYMQHDALTQYTSADDSTLSWELKGDGSAQFAGPVTVYNPGFSSVDFKSDRSNVGDTIGGIRCLDADGNNQAYVYGHLDGGLSIGTDGVERIRVNKGGTTQFPGPISIGGTSGANQINEYEEGYWTPNLGGNETVNIAWGKYVKVGTFVQCWGGLRPTSIGTGNPRTIQNLPFLASGYAGGTSQGGGAIVWCDGAAVDFYSVAITVVNSTKIADVNVVTAATKVLQNSNDFWEPNFRANFYINYFTEN